MTAASEPLDLAPIRARAEAAREHMGYIGYRSVFAPVVEVDIPALLAEVDRLRSLLGEGDWEYAQRTASGKFLTWPLSGLPSLSEGSTLLRRRKAGPWVVVPHE